MEKPEDNLIFQKKVKNSFLKVKEDINYLKNKINALEELILTKFKEINVKLEKLRENRFILEKIQPNQPDSKKVPQEIKGSILTQPQLNLNLTLTQPQLNQELISDLPSKLKLNEHIQILSSLTRTELLICLTILQLEDEQNLRPTYEAMSKKLKMPIYLLKCHISHIFKKGAPIIKNKINNRFVSFHMPNTLKLPEVKEKLTSLYYTKEPTYKSLT